MVGFQTEASHSWSSALVLKTSVPQGTVSSNLTASAAYNEGMFFFLVKMLIGVLAVFVLVGVFRTWTLEHSPDQVLFANGTVPEPLPDGLYQGSVQGPAFSWAGKKFDASHSVGINEFHAIDGLLAEKYPFVTTVAQGVNDTGVSVLDIDYNIPANPWWLRPVLDEIVQVSPDQYLGKMQLRLIPGVPFTVTFFELKK